MDAQPNPLDGTTYLFGLWLVVVWVFPVLAWAQAELPASVLLYEHLKSLMPHVQTLDGLSLCALLAKRHEPQPFLVQLSDWGLDTCDLSHVILAYGGWATAEMEDPTDPHFSPPIHPSVEIVHYDTWTVLYVNHGRHAHVLRTPEGRKAALQALQHLQSYWVGGDHPPLDIRGAGRPLLPLPRGE